MGATSAQSTASPAFRYRVLLPRAELSRHGVAIEPLPLFQEDDERRFREGTTAERVRLVRAGRGRLLSRLRSEEAGLETMLIQRQADLFPSLRLERAAADHRRLIWDVDDAIWHDTSEDAHGHALTVLKGTRRKARWLARRADRVIAGNRILAEWVADYTDKIEVVPSVVETRDIRVREHRETNLITLGWIGTQSNAPHLSAMQAMLGRLNRIGSGPQFRLLTVGGKVDPIEGIEVEHRAYSDETEHEALATIDIGLMPLPDSPWTRGKCAHKALKYMAAGIPAIGDDVGVAGETIGDGGRVVNSDGEWTEAIVELARDQGLRARLGRNARRRVEEEYSVIKWAPVLASILR